MVISSPHLSITGPPLAEFYSGLKIFLQSLPDFVKNCHVECILGEERTPVQRYRRKQREVQWKDSVFLILFRELMNTADADTNPNLLFSHSSHLGSMDQACCPVILSGPPIDHEECVRRGLNMFCSAINEQRSARPAQSLGRVRLEAQLADRPIPKCLLPKKLHLDEHNVVNVLMGVTRPGNPHTLWRHSRGSNLVRWLLQQARRQ